MMMPSLKGQKKILTPEEKFKRELQTETELLRYQRQYHILQCDRKLHKGGSGQKQRKVINILKKEYNEILTDLSVAASEANFKNDNKVAKTLEKLIEEHNHFKCEIKREKAYLNELDMQIVMAKKTIVELRSKTLTEIQATIKINQEQHTLEALENKLDTATKRFCTTIACNRKLREEIDHLLIERFNFNKNWDRLCKQLSHGKKFMLDLIEQATLAYDQREEWCQKLTALRSKAYNEYLGHTQVMTNIQRQIDYAEKLEEFLDTKGQRRIMENLMRKEQERRQQQKEEMQALLESYNETIQNIQEFMEETDMALVAKIYSQNEVNNFSKFKFINELNLEIENLSDELHALQMRISDQEELNEVRTAGQADKLAKLEAKYEQIKTDAEETDKNFNLVDGTVKELLSEIEGLFALCKCSKAPLLELLGDNSTINIYNCLIFLKILEQRINDMITTVFYKDTKRYKKSDIIHADKVTSNIITITDLVTKDPCPLCVEQALVSDVIDTLQHVMGKAQIAERLEEAIEKRGFNEVVHNVSGCHLPKSRAIIQRRYQ